ncbi:hypothetical protein ABH920_003070 [Catenulispora sp. EB89]|uniref:hypothetical protein n=1 Tax=Catenulispora sp. EB89 TaxID=3156257 RepID=UPI0035120877
MTSDDDRAIETTVKVDVSAGVPLITELHLKAAPGGGVTPSEAMELLLRALPQSTFAETDTSAASSDQPTGVVRPVGESSAPARVSVPAAVRPSAEPGSERAYRTMPAGFVEAFHEYPTIGALADAFGVPRYTAQAWVNTARRRGQLPSAKKRTRRR